MLSASVLYWQPDWKTVDGMLYDCYYVYNMCCKETVANFFAFETHLKNSSHVNSRIYREMPNKHGHNLMKRKHSLIKYKRETKIIILCIALAVIYKTQTYVSN